MPGLPSKQIRCPLCGLPTFLNPATGRIRSHTRPGRDGRRCEGSGWAVVSCESGRLDTVAELRSKLEIAIEDRDLHALNCAAQARREATEEAIAFMIFVADYWAEGRELADMPPEEVKSLYARWREHWLPAKEGIHDGDCVKAPAPCTRCHVEGILEAAKRLSVTILPEVGQ